VVGNNAGLQLSGTGTHEVTVTGTTSSGRLGQDAQGFFFASDTPGKVIKFDTNNGTLNEWMRITSTGNVGIGTSTPAAKLDVAGNLSVSGVVSGNGSGLTNVNVGAVVPSGFSVLGATPVPPPGGFSDVGWLALSGQQSWATQAAMPTARWWIAVGVVNGKIYVIGGYNGGYLATVEEYTPATNSWATKTAMPTARAGAAAAVVNGTIYVIGGYNGGHLATVEAYTPATDTWATEATMPVAHSDMSAAAFNGKVYAFGGELSSFFTANSTYSYDPSTNTWSVKTAMPTARSGSASVAVNNLIYVIGGLGNAGYVTTNEAYDPTADAWTTKASMANARHYLAAETVNGLIYVLGGFNSSPLAVAEVYDPTSNVWFQTAPMPTARFGLVAGAANNTIYAIGGTTTGSDNLATNEQFDPSKLTYLFKKN
jgi:N-acetylneuraminic acid mutarotase